MAETCVFGKQSLEPVACNPLTGRPITARQLLGHPFFQRYGVNLPSSLTEVGSSTWGVFPQPTGVGMRYGQNGVWLAAFLGGLGPSDFRLLSEARASRQVLSARVFPRTDPSVWQPILSIRWVHSPYRVPASLLATRSGAGLSHLLAIAYDYDVLGLGPDSPWGDCRCPGTLRLAVWMVRTSMTLLIPAFALVCAPPVLAVWLPGGTQRSPTMRVTTATRIHSFGGMLEPRYVVGARALDQ